MPISARAVAAELRARQPGLGVLKLHKLLYYCQGHHLAVFGEPLFNERVSAFDNGPVVGKLWHSEKNGEAVDEEGPTPDEAVLNTVGYVVSRYGALSGTDLIHLTHSEEPWRRANESRLPGTSAPIEIQWIRDYFRSVALDSDDNADDVVLDSSDVARWLHGATSPQRGDLDTDRDEARAESARLVSRLDSLRTATGDR